MKAPAIHPSQILASYRKTDAVLIVCQHNAKKTVEIAALNEEAMKVLGYDNKDVVGKPLSVILPERIASTVAEFVEYKEEGNDLLAVLNKVRSFALKPSSSIEAEFKLKIIRGEPIDRNPCFHLVLLDEAKMQKRSKFREVLKENFKGHEVLDDRTALPNRASIVKDLEVVTYYVRNKSISASFAILDINNYERLIREHGYDTCTQLHRHIGQVCKLKLRGEDTIGTLSDRMLCVILVDAEQEPARMVLNRLRWAIGSSPMEIKKGDVVAQVNIGFCQIHTNMREAEILQKCEDFMAELRGEVTNSIQLIPVYDRRQQGSDRRKSFVSVAVDRRRHDRRRK